MKTNIKFNQYQIYNVIDFHKRYSFNLYVVMLELHYSFKLGQIALQISIIQYFTYSRVKINITNNMYQLEVLLEQTLKTEESV